MNTNSKATEETCVGNSKKEDLIRWDNQFQKITEACSEIGTSSSNNNEGQNIFSRRELAVVNSCHELLEVSRQTLKEVARQAIQCAEDYERENRNPCSTTKAVQECAQNGFKNYMSKVDPWERWRPCFVT